MKELIHARQSVVVHAKAYGLQAIDMVYINFKGMNHTHVSEICCHVRKFNIASGLQISLRIKTSNYRKTTEQNLRNSSEKSVFLPSFKFGPFTVC